MDSFEKFKKRQEITRFAENFKMGVVGVLTLSVLIFIIAGKEAVKPFILYWAGFMVLLLIVCAVQDFRNARKIKKLGIGYERY